MISQTEHELTGVPSVDKPWLKNYGEEVMHRSLPDGSMYDYMTFCNAVVGKRNGEKGYLVIAYVTLKSRDIEDKVEKELRQLCRQKLKENSWPLEYHFIEKLPTTGAGKIDFKTLEIWSERGK